MLLGFEAYELGAYAAVNPPPRPHPGYRGFMRWVREQASMTCWPGPMEAATAYLDATSVRVDPGR